MNLKRIHELIDDIEATFHTVDEYFGGGWSRKKIEFALTDLEELRNHIPAPLHTIENGTRIQLFGECEVILKGESKEEAYNRLYDVGSQTGFSVYKDGNALYLYGDRNFRVIYWTIQSGWQIHSIHEIFPIWHNSEVE